MEGNGRWACAIQLRRLYVYYTYDEDYDCYSCEQSLDEDEMARFLSGSYRECPYYHPGDLGYYLAGKQ